MNNWINIKDKLPNHQETILVRSNKGFCVCIFVDTVEMNKKLFANALPIDRSSTPYRFCSQEIKGNVLNGVTHWMYLSEPKE